MGDLLPVLDRIIGKTQVIRFRDRDDSTPQEVEEDNLGVSVRTMSEFRNIESMLLSDAVLARLCESVDQPEHFQKILAARNTALEGNQGRYADDDLKPAAQAVHQAARTRLRLPQPGRTKGAFMSDVLAPLVTDDTREYQTLRNDIFGKHVELA